MGDQPKGRHQSDYLKKTNQLLLAPGQKLSKAPVIKKQHQTQDKTVFFALSTCWLQAQADFNTSLLSDQDLQDFKTALIHTYAVPQIGTSISTLAFIKGLQRVAAQDAPLAMRLLCQQLPAQAKVWRAVCRQVPLPQVLAALLGDPNAPNEFGPNVLQQVLRQSPLDDVNNNRPQAEFWLSRCAIVLCAQKLAALQSKPQEYQKLWINLIEHHFFTQPTAKPTPEQQQLEQTILALADRSSQGIPACLVLATSFWLHSETLLTSQADLNTVLPLLNPKLLKGKTFQVCTLLQSLEKLYQRNFQSHQPQSLVQWFHLGFDSTDSQAKIPLQTKPLFNALLQLNTYLSDLKQDFPRPAVFDTSHTALALWFHGIEDKVQQLGLTWARPDQAFTQRNQMVIKAHSQAQLLLKQLDNHSLLEYRARQQPEWLSQAQLQLWDGAFDQNLPYQEQVTDKQELWTFETSCNPVKSLELSSKALGSCLNIYRDFDGDNFWLNRFLSCLNRQLNVYQQNAFVGRAAIRLVKNFQQQPHLLLDKFYWNNEKATDTHQLALAHSLKALTKLSNKLSMPLILSQQTMEKLNDPRVHHPQRMFTQPPLLAPDYIDSDIRASMRLTRGRFMTGETPNYSGYLVKPEQLDLLMSSTSKALI